MYALEGATLTLKSPPAGEFKDKSSESQLNRRVFNTITDKISVSQCKYHLSSGFDSSINI